MVGDVKQSIYRFRLADPTIFTGKYERFADAPQPEGVPRRVFLRESFRSRPEVVSAVNAAFAALMSRSLGELDYDENAHIGKPTCNDLRDGKVTLPLIYALRTAPADRRDRVLQAIRQKDFSPESIHAIVRFAREEGGIAYAEEQMARYRRLALDELAAFPAGAEKAALEAAADFAVTRQK